MNFALGVVIFVVALLVSVMLHEAGHFATAKKFGMKVTQFFVGFGQTLWSRRKGETEYGVKAIPAGGFVKIVGMTDLEEVDEADEPRSFRRQPGWQRMIVLSAGSFTHFALAFVLMFAVAVGIGLATPTTSVQTVGACVPSSLTAACKAGEPASPAKKAGLQPGDTIVSVAGHPARSWGQMGKVIREQPTGVPVAIVVRRDGKQSTLHASLASIPGRPGAYLGISPVVQYQRSGPLGAAAYAGSTFGQITVSTGKLAAHLPQSVTDVFAKNRASTQGGQVASVVGVADVSGQVLAEPIGWQAKASLILLLIASVNVFVGLFNLLPLLPLDGGHLAVVIFERVRAWLARLRGRPDPGLVDMRRLIPVSVGVFALLVGYGLLLIMADILNPLHIAQ